MTLGPGRQPAAPRPAASRARSASRRGRRPRRGSSGRAGPPSRRVTDTVDTEPGGRYGSIARERLARCDGKADPQAGERVGLAQRADDDQAAGTPCGAAGRWSRRTPRRPRRGRRPAARGGRPARRRREAVEEARDRAIGLRQGGRVVRAAQPDEVGTARRSSRVSDEVDRPAGVAPSRGTGRTRARALLGQDAIHGVRRAWGSRPCHRPAGTPSPTMSRISSAPGADEDLVGRDAVARSGRLGQPTVVGGRVLGQRRSRSGRRRGPWRRAPAAPGSC